MLHKPEKPNLARSLNLILLYHSNNGSKKFIGERPWEAKLGGGEPLACLSSDTGMFFKMKLIASRPLNELPQKSDHQKELGFDTIFIVALRGFGGESCFFRMPSADSSEIS
jgi:hypothetical protein